MSYAHRVVDDLLDLLLDELPAIAIEGPRGVGKTETATRRAASILHLDEPGDLEAASDGLEHLGLVPPVLVDEWQRFPPVWDQVRRSVDRGAAAASFLLTGSAVPLEAPVHSGAGRIVSIRMRPMALSERGLGSQSVSLVDLLTGSRSPIGGVTDVDIAGYVDEITRSGFPGIRVFGERARRLQLEGYLDRIVQHDFAEQGLAVRRPHTLRNWLTAYAAATSTTASYNVILDAATAGETDKPAKTTTIAYRDVLTSLWLLDPVPGWLPRRTRFSALARAPKHHLADPALAAHLLGATPESLIRREKIEPSIPRHESLLGALFESLVTLSVRVYAEAAEATVRHFRTRDGRHEADIIVERRDGKVIALEIKSSATPGDESARHLTWLRDRLGDDLLDAAVITTGRRAYRRDDGIAVIPAALLGP